MTREADVAERDRLETQLESFKGTTDRAAMLRQAAAYLRHLPAAWSAASAEQRDALTRLVFRSVEITDGAVTAVMAEADFAPFFLQEAVMAGRRDGHADGPAEVVPSNELWIGRKRRGSRPRARAFLTTTADRTGFAAGLNGQFDGAQSMLAVQRVEGFRAIEGEHPELESPGEALLHLKVQRLNTLAAESRCLSNLDRQAWPISQRSLVLPLG